MKDKHVDTTRTSESPILIQGPPFLFGKHGGRQGIETWSQRQTIDVLDTVNDGYPVLYMSLASRPI